MGPTGKGPFFMDLQPIPGYDGYFASRCGCIVSHRKYKPTVLKPSSHTMGYRQVGLRTDSGKFKTQLVHQMVLLAWVGPRPYGAVVNHINGDKTDNRLENLEYCSQSENMAHACRLGLSPKPPTRRGRNAPKAKLCEEQVLKLRAMACEGVRVKELAEAFGVTPATASKIVLRQTWRHI